MLLLIGVLLIIIPLPFRLPADPAYLIRSSLEEADSVPPPTPLWRAFGAPLARLQRAFGTPLAQPSLLALFLHTGCRGCGQVHI